MVFNVWYFQRSLKAAFVGKAGTRPVVAPLELCILRVWVLAPGGDGGDPVGGAGVWPGGADSAAPPWAPGAGEGAGRCADLRPLFQGFLSFNPWMNVGSWRPLGETSVGTVL